ncbi:MAG: hypothetical protein JXA98_05245 [Methanosarcinaceae archaeon]|nr:hypothetical protein [Methanosarcinaceae archaeon]
MNIAFEIIVDDGIMSCLHESCGRIDKVWLPFEIRGADRGLKPHLYCTRCGAIKSISTEKPKKTTYYINSLSKIDKRVVPLTKVQVRLIVKELEHIEDFEDPYSMTREIQEKIFITVVKKYCRVSEAYLASMLN